MGVPRLLPMIVIFAVCFVMIKQASSYEITEKVFFKIKAGSQTGTVVIGVYGDVVPKTAKNFVDLANAPEGKGYKGTKIFRILPNFFIQGGDIINNDGTGVDKEDFFDDENFLIKHNTPWKVTMASAGPNTNNSQFMIFSSAAPWLNGKNVAFGVVLEGHEFLLEIEKFGSASGHVSKDIEIVDSGSINE